MTIIYSPICELFIVLNVLIPIRTPVRGSKALGSSSCDNDLKVDRRCWKADHIIDVLELEV